MTECNGMWRIRRWSEALWSVMNDFPAPAVSSDFDLRLERRIRKRSSSWIERNGGGRAPGFAASMALRMCLVMARSAAAKPARKNRSGGRFARSHR